METKKDHLDLSNILEVAAHKQSIDGKMRAVASVRDSDRPNAREIQNRMLYLLKRRGVYWLNQVKMDGSHQTNAPEMRDQIINRTEYHEHCAMLKAAVGRTVRK